MKKTLSENYKQRFKDYLKGKGLACTDQRTAILDYLMNSHSHYSPETLLQELQKKGFCVSRATVYRTLTHLEEAGFIREIALNTEHSHYEFIGQTVHHEHIVCESCGKIIEFSDPVLEDRIEKIAYENGFKINRHNVQISGTCRNCHEK